MFINSKKSMFAHEYRPIFVVSAGRSGSKLLSLILAEHSTIIAFHEPKPYLSTLGYHSWRSSRKSMRIKREIWENRSGLINQVYINNYIYAESSFFLAHIIFYLHELFNGRIIYLYRDGRDFVRSGLTRPWYKKTSMMTYIARYLRRLTLQPFGNPIEDHLLSPPRNAVSRFEKISWLWNEVNSNISSQLQSIQTDDIFMLPIEKMSKDTISDLFCFLNLKTTNDELEKMENLAITRPNKSQIPYSIPAKDMWSKQQMTTFLRFAGEQMRRLGYQHE